MADDITYTSTSPAGVPNSTKQATDEHATRGHMPIVKLAYSADGTATHVQADIDGLLVNLGSNNDITLATLPDTSGGDLAAIKTAAQIIDNFISGSRGLVTEDNSASIKTAVEILDNFISGSRGLVTEDNSASSLTALQLIDDIVAVLGTATYAEATTKGAVIAAVRRDADTTLVDTTNEIAPLQVDANGRLKVEAFSGETLPVSLSSTTVTGTVAVTQSGAWDEVGINDSGNVITVDGSGSAGSAASGVVTVQGVASMTPIQVGDNSDSLTVDNAALSVTGGGVEASALRVTLANDSTGVVSVDDNGGALTVDGTVSANLNAGTNNIGDVDVLTLPGSLTGYAEDAAHNSGDIGVQALAVRKDTGAAIAGTDGDYSPLQVDSSGNLRVNVVTGGGTGGTSETDDAAFTAASGSYTPVGGIVTSDSVDSGDGGAFAMLANRQQKVTLYDSGGVELAVGGGTQYTEDAAAAANPVGNALMLVREDARAGTLVSADGDNVAARGNNKGELYVKTTDADALLTTIDADTSALAGAVSGTEMQVDIVSSAAIPVTDNSGSLTVDNAGTFAVQVDGAALTALQLIDDAVFAEDVAAQAADKGVAVLAVRRDADTSLVGADNDYANLQVDANGYLKVEVFDGGGSHTVDNAGTFAVQVDGNALTALQLIDDPVIADDAAFTPATTKVMMAGFEADEGSTDSVDEGDAGAARMTLDRKLITTAQGHTAGGLSTFMASGSDGSSILVATAQAIKASAGQLYGYFAYNPEAAVTFVHFYNTAAASVTVGTTNPLFTIQLPAGAAANMMFPVGVTFSNAGWSCAATTTAGGNTAPATGVSLTVWYM